MSEPPELLSQVRIASPCTVPVSSMSGDDRIRHCSKCTLNVYNLSSMTAAEAESFLLERQDEERTCVSFLRRLDGTIKTADAADDLNGVRETLIRGAQILVVVGLFLLSTLSALAESGRKPQQKNSKPSTEWVTAIARCINLISRESVIPKLSIG